MNPKHAALLALMVVAACDGNPLGTEPEEPCTEDCPVGADDPVVAPDVLKNNVTRIVYNADDNSFQVEIAELDTTPRLATWERDPRFDTAGYRAYSVQEDPLDRLFVGLAKTSDDGSVTAAVAGDGGQFNKFYSGGDYSREGNFSPEGSGGQVSYAGTYAGITNIPAAGGELLPVPPGTDPELAPVQTSRVSGDIFLNANFDDNAVNGAVYNRVLVDYGFGLQSVILVEGEIAANGTFQGKTERWVNDDPEMAITGDFGGVFGGEGAAAVGGVVALEQMFDSAGDEIENGRERGIFVLRQCGLSGDSAVCDAVRPDF